MPGLATIGRPPRLSLRALLDDVALTILRDQNGRLLAARERAVKFPPSGCRWCGLDRRLHFQRWTDEAGWHIWEHPTQEQFKARILARRAERQQTTTPTTGA